MINHSTKLFPLLVAISIGMYLPAVDDILNEFQTSEFLLGLSLTLFLTTVALFGRFISPIASRLGSKKLALISAFLFVAGSLLCFFSWSIEILLLGRIVQAAGATGALTISFSWGIVAVVLFLSPTVGSFIHWRSAFLLMAFCGGFVAAISFLVSEIPLKPRIRMISIHTLSAACGVATFTAFFAVAPYIFSDLLMLPRAHFGLYFGTQIVFYLLALLMHRKLSIEPALTLGTLFTAAGGLLMLALYLILGTTTISFLLPMGFATVGATLLTQKTTGGPLSLLGSLLATPLTAWGVSSTMPFALTLIATSTITLTAGYYALRTKETPVDE